MVTRTKLGVSFKRRKDGLKKKALELSILCGIDACVVIKGPEGQTHCWPENPNKVRSVIQKYRDCEKKNKKKKGSAVKGKSDSGWMMTTGRGETLEQQLSVFAKEKLESLLADVDKKIEDVKDRIEVVKFTDGLHNNVNTVASTSQELLDYGFFPTEMFDCVLGQDQAFGDEFMNGWKIKDDCVASSSKVIMNDGYFLMENEKEMFDWGLDQDQSFGDNGLMWKRSNLDYTFMNQLQNNGNCVASSSQETTNYGYFTREMIDCELGQDQAFGDNGLMGKRSDLENTFMDELQNNDNGVASSSKVMMDDEYFWMENQNEITGLGLIQDESFRKDVQIGKRSDLEVTFMNELQNKDNGVALSSKVTMNDGSSQMDDTKEMFDWGLGQDQCFGEEEQIRNRVNFEDTFMNDLQSKDDGVASSSKVTVNDGSFQMDNRKEMFNWGLDQDQCFGEDAQIENGINFEDTLVWSMEDFEAVGILL